MSDFFKDLTKKISENVKGAHASVMADSDIATERFDVMTPCFDLNRILSGSMRMGIKSRNLMGIIGPEHTMKSSFMVLCMVNAQKQGYKPVIIDTEGGCDSAFCERWGLDTENCYYVYTPFINEVMSVLAQIRETGEQNLVIGIDSVGGLQRLKAYEDALDGDMKQDQGLLQKEIKAMLKLYLNICISQNSIGIATGHYYGSPDKYEPNKIGGGKAMKLLPSILVTLRKEVIREEPKKKESPVIGSKIIATTIKNRMYPPFQSAEIEIDYETGVSAYAGILDLAVKGEIVDKAGSWYSYKGERLGQGKKKATLSLEGLDEILDEVDEWLESTGYSTYNEEAEKAEKILAEERGGDVQTEE